VSHSFLKPLFVAAAAMVISLSIARPAQAQLAPQERLCDPMSEDCRADLRKYIQQEKVGIDAAFWLLTDEYLTQDLIQAWQRGVPVRLLVDPRCDENHGTLCTDKLDRFKTAGIPMRYRATSGILHWKMMLFAGQGQVEFAGANFTSFELKPATPNVNYTDEIVYYTKDAQNVQSFMKKFDDLWTSTTEFKDYANITTPLTRKYDPTFTISADLNFPPDQSYRSRAVGRYNAETKGIDVIMFRITDVSHTNAMVAAMNRGVPVRLLTDKVEYRNTDRLWDAYNVDIMYNAGAQVRWDIHEGINHEKLVLLQQQQMAIFGSSNWTSPSTSSQREHNLFTTHADLYAWARAQFDRKWADDTNYADFVPLPPGKPTNVSPANLSTGQSTTVTLTWNGGLWGQVYDVYLGKTSNPTQLVMQNVELGPSQSSSDNKKFTVPFTLDPGTTYYWKVVSKTKAYPRASANGINVTATGSIWSFTTAGQSGGGGGGGSTLPAPWTDKDVGSVGAAGSASSTSASAFTVKGAGADVWGTSDAFNYAYQSLTGDGTIVARVATVQNTASWAKAGVMIRGSLNTNAAQAFMLVSAGKGVAFQRRKADGASSLSTAGTLSKAPRWVKLTRSSSTITAYESADGSTWTKVGSDTFTMPSTVFIGLAVSSHVQGVICTATFDGVAVSTGTTAQLLPSGWSSQDIGAVTGKGQSSYSAATFTITGQGADIWGTADAFQYAYHALSGDGTIIARVASLQHADAWTKAGVMIRGALTATASHAFALVSAAKGVAFQRRPTSGGSSIHTAGSTATAPRWVKLTRNGNLFSAYESANGSTWTLIGSDTITMPTSAFIGLAVTSHDTATPATAAFDNVIIQ
jgi:phosphatidylserine/phosphatidylglycerophosphate/cardiolipin synthase-like enzyme/regulation of enolase protein 1 (concanavalin A-like superfamily)